MASRTKQKEEARARRLAEEQARADQARRRRRMQMLGGVVLIAAAVVAVAIAVSSNGGGGTPSLKTGKHLKPCQGADAAVCNLLKRIPQSGSTLGSPDAKVLVTEYIDLECPICDALALSPSQTTSDGTPGSGVEDQLISKDVRSGKVKLTFKSLETATAGAPDPNIFGPQQAAAVAAGLQGKAWYYVELFYLHQGKETTGYVNQAYLDKLAKLVPDLNYNKWLTDSRSPSLISQVTAENRTSNVYLTQIGATSQGQVGTPTLLIKGPKGQAQPIVTFPSYAQVESEINSVQ